jgi:hypothetical protein
MGAVCRARSRGVIFSLSSELSAQDTSTEKLCRWSCVAELAGQQSRPLLDCLVHASFAGTLPPLHLTHLFLTMMKALKMTPTAPASAAELISLPHIEIIDPPNKLRQEIKTKNSPRTHHGNEFGATLTSCCDTPDDPVQLPSLAVPGSDSDGNGSLTPLICFGQFTADPQAGRGFPLDSNFSRAADVLIFPYDPLPCRPLHPDPPTLHAPGN